MSLAEIIQNLEQSIFRQSKVTWNQVWSEEGRKRFEVLVLRSEDQGQLMAVAVLDNHRGTPDYKRGWAELLFVIRDPTVEGNGIASRFLDTIRWRLQRKGKVGSESVHSILFRVPDHHPGLVSFYKRQGFVLPLDLTGQQSGEEGILELHWYVRPRASCVLL